jgi:hypothetical protein
MAEGNKKRNMQKLQEGVEKNEGIGTQLEILDTGYRVLI